MNGAGSLILCSLLAFGVHGKKITFGNGNRVLDVVTNAECGWNYVDAKNTGSYLFSKYVNNRDGLQKATLSMDIQLVHYNSKQLTCFRAHPVVINCVQDAITKLKSEKMRVRVIEGYRNSTSSTKPEDEFAAAGTAIHLAPMSGKPGDVLTVAKGVLRFCPAKMESIHRNIGIVLKATSLHVFMGGPTDPAVFTTDGYANLTDSEFKDQVFHAINLGLEMGKKVSDCTGMAKLTHGQMFPADATSAENTVGEMEVAVTREDTVDFGRMVMYMGTAVKFANNERSASWCGQPSGPRCVDCRTGPVDVTLNKRCTARVMTSRMRNVLTLLQKLTFAKMAESVLVMQAWDEDYDGHVAPTSSLHREGRALLVKLVSDKPAKLSNLSQLAICANADFVQHNGTHLLIAVEKQHGDTASEIIFLQEKLVRVDPPHSKSYLFALPDYFDEDDLAASPIFDSAGREQLQIAAHTMLGMFKSNITRHLRLNERVAECFSVLQDYFVKRQDTDGPVTLEVVRGFLTTPERDVLFTPTDHRYASGIQGLSFEIRANSNQSTQHVTVAELARLAIKQCTPVFQWSQDSQIGVGVYHDRVYVDMRENFKFWNPAGAFTPNVRSSSEFKTYMESLLYAALDGRIVEPDVPSEAAALSEPPQRQATAYNYVTPEAIRRRQQTGLSPGECVPNSSTKFCTDSEIFRKRLIAKWWKEVAKKHSYRGIDELKSAFFGCFGLCGTCTSGEFYEKKLMHCNNFLHWAPFEVAPEGTAINLFPMERPELKKCACRGGSHCILDSALFLLVVNLFEATFRPDPDSSVTEDMYPQTENPIPVAEIVNQLYAIHHEGVAKIWVEDDTDIAAMRGTLQKLMVYNPNVTEVVVYVNELSAVDAVDSVFRSLILDWATSISPLYSREFIAPYTITDVESHCRITSKRSAHEHSERQKIIGNINANEDKYLDFDI